MPDYSIDMSVQKREDCGLDNVFTIFKAYNHPVLLVEECAMRWMGLRVSPEEVRERTTALAYSFQKVKR